MTRIMIGTGAKVPIGVASMPYRCKTCGMAFGSNKELEAHNKKAHGKKR